MSTEKNKLTITVSEGDKSERLDIYLSHHPEYNLTRTKIQKLIEQNMITVNGQFANKKYKVKAKDEIIIEIPPVEEMELKPENIFLEIVFEDEWLAVVNKPANLVTHPGAGNRKGTLVNALLYHFKSLAVQSDPERPGLVHRLDKDTSGLLLIAKNDETYLKLQQLIQTRKIKRTYLALICGHLADDEGEINLPIGRSIKDRKKMAVTNINSREAITRYKLVKRYRSYDLLDVNLMTGRTHQIRVHFSHLGHPIFGDHDYGGREKWNKGIFAPERELGKRLLKTIDRQALHARALSFVHPHTNQEINLESNPPGDIIKLLKILDNEGY